MTAPTHPMLSTRASGAAADGGAAGIVFDIQRYSVHDGPGIRTILFFKGCPLRCPWCANPESLSGTPQLWQQKRKCIGCGACFAVCPRQALEPGEQGVAVDWDRCDQCARCAGECCSGALEMIGRSLTVDEAVEAVLRDRAFYGETGGVTLSGGEPLLQAAFAARVLQRCKELGLRTAVETSGFAEWRAVADIVPFTDCFLYDVKVMDPGRHVALVGVDNRRILENARRIAAAGKPVTIRVPVVPAVNDDAENLRATLRFAETIGAESVDFLPYHRLGEPKWERLGKNFALAGTPMLAEDRLREILDDLGALGEARIPVTAGGG